MMISVVILQEGQEGRRGAERTDEQSVCELSAGCAKWMERVQSRSSGFQVVRQGFLGKALPVSE